MQRMTVEGRGHSEAEDNTVDESRGETKTLERTIQSMATDGCGGNSGGEDNTKDECVRERGQSRKKAIWRKATEGRGGQSAQGDNTEDGSGGEKRTQWRGGQYIG